jgi:hypothetical protein
MKIKQKEWHTATKPLKKTLKHAQVQNFDPWCWCGWLA